MIEFFRNFLIFNQNAFFSIIYFLWTHIWLILGLVSIGYIFFTEQLADRENDVRDERQIL